MRQHLDLAGDQVGVDRAFGTRPHQAGHGDDELVAQLFGGGESRGAIGIADDLHQSFAVAQVDEDHAAVVAAAMDPAADGDGLAEAGAVDAAAVVGAFHVLLRRRIRCMSWAYRKAQSLAARARRRRATRVTRVNFGVRYGSRSRQFAAERRGRRGFGHDDAHRDDVFQRFVDRHVEIVHARARQHQKNPEVGFGVVGT